MLRNDVLTQIKNVVNPAKKKEQKTAWFVVLP